MNHLKNINSISNQDGSNFEQFSVLDLYPELKTEVIKNTPRRFKFVHTPPISAPSLENSSPRSRTVLYNAITRSHNVECEVKPIIYKSGHVGGYYFKFYLPPIVSDELDITPNSTLPGASIQFNYSFESNGFSMRNILNSNPPTSPSMFTTRSIQNVGYPGNLSMRGSLHKNDEPENSPPEKAVRKIEQLPAFFARIIITIEHLDHDSGIRDIIDSVCFL